MCPIEIQKFRLAGEQNRKKTAKQPPPRHKHGEKFLRGPIPLTWLSRASKLSGKALHVGIVLWFRAGIEQNRTIKLSNLSVKVVGLTRYSKNRALKHLESAGLITVERCAGRSPVVTILRTD